MSGSITSTETTTEISTVWVIDCETLKAFAADSSKKLRSPTFGQGRWQLCLHEKREDQLKPGSIKLLLAANVVREDVFAATSKQAWVRPGSWNASFKVSSNGGKKTWSFDTCHAYSYEYSSTNFSFGKTTFEDQATFASFYADSDTIRIDCTVKAGGVPEAPRERSTDRLLTIFFDKPEVTDVVFTFPEESAGRRIFASRAILEHCSEYYKNLFSSGFSEANELVNIDVANLPRFKNGNVGRDEDDMGIFEIYDENDDREAKRRKVDEQKKLETATPSLRSMIEIKVTDTCFYAYRAMLAYMHFDLVPFTALPSDYLVARQKALAEHESTSATESFTFPRRAKWLQDQFKALKGQPDWQGVQPCSPHAIYRLAHRYDMQELLAVVKARIFRCLDVQNAAYELFSPLSIVHDEIQDGILDYMSENWGQIKETRAWKDVVEKIASGELVHAAPVIKKVFELMQLVPK